MSKRTVLDEEYKGLVEAFQIPVELHERDGKRFASMSSVLPIHCATPEQLAQRAQTTHHYCGVFTDELLAPLCELAYVRLDENLAEKVFLNRSKRVLLVSSDGKLAQWRCAPTFESANRYIAGTPIVNKDGALVSVVTARRGNHYAVSAFENVFLNRSKRVLLVSSDGKLAQWRCAPTFESANRYIAGTPIVNKDGALVSVVTARRGNHYAVSAFEGDGGYFTTSKSWEVIDQEEGKLFYGDRNFCTREELTEYIKGLPPVEVNPQATLKPVLLRGKTPRIALVSENGNQLSHHYLFGVLTDGVEYL